MTVVRVEGEERVEGVEGVEGEEGEEKVYNPAKKASIQAMRSAKKVST